MENDLISVIIPVYNGEKTLEGCIKAVLSQDYRNLELIVVDNNSTDGTRGIIEKYETDARVRYVFEPKKSRGAARNAGISAANGDIVCMTDADCLPPADWMRKITEPIRNENESVVLGLVNNIVESFWAKKFHAADVAFFDRNKRGAYINHFNGANFAAKKSILLSVMFDPNIIAFEDYDFYLRLKKLVRIRFLPEVQVGDHFDDSLLKVVAKNFDRGLWLARIYLKNKSFINKGEDAMLESFSIRNFATWPFWLAAQIILQGLTAFIYLLCSETPFRIGIISGLISAKWNNQLLGHGNDQYIVITEAETSGRLIDFLHFNPQCKVITSDRYVSNVLSRRGINNLCAYDFIDNAEELAIYEQAIEQANTVFNEIIADQKPENKEYAILFDCIKSQASFIIFDAYYYNKYYSQLWAKIRPKKVFLYDYPRNIQCDYVINSLETGGFDYSLLSLSYVRRGLIKLQHLPQFINSYYANQRINTESYSTFRSKLFSRRRKISRDNGAMIARNKDRTNNVIFSILLFERDLAAYLPLLNALKSNGKNPIVVAPHYHSDRVAALLRHYGIGRYTLNFNQSHKAIDLPEDFLSYKEDLIAKLLPAGLYHNRLRRKLMKMLNIENKFVTYRASREIFENLFIELKPRELWTCHYFGLFSNLACKIAENQGIIKISQLNIRTENSFYNLIIPPASSIVSDNHCSPELFIVTGENFSAGIKQMRSVKGSVPLVKIWNNFKPSNEPTEVKIDHEALMRGLGVSSVGRLIVFTGQALSYNFSFIREVINAFEILITNEEFKDYYLLIRPHPFESLFVYRYLANLKSEHVIISRNFAISDILAHAELLITYSSFTAVEMMAEGKQVLILDWLHKPERPGFFDLPLARKIDTVDNLDKVLMEMLAAPLIRTADFEEKFRKFFQANCGSIEDLLNEIEAV